MDEHSGVWLKAGGGMEVRAPNADPIIHRGINMQPGTAWQSPKGDLTIVCDQSAPTTATHNHYINGPAIYWPSAVVAALVFGIIIGRKARRWAR